MNRPLVTSLLFASVSMVGVFATIAFAGAAQTAGTAAAVDASVPAQAASQSGDNARADATPPVERNCMHYTGSRIVARSNTTRSASRRKDRDEPRCVIANGRVYSREDIERTGEIDIADALRKLDPSIH